MRELRWTPKVNWFKCPVCDTDELEKHETGAVLKNIERSEIREGKSKGILSSFPTVIQYNCTCCLCGSTWVENYVPYSKSQIVLAIDKEKDGFKTFCGFLDRYRFEPADDTSLASIKVGLAHSLSNMFPNQFTQADAKIIEFNKILIRLRVSVYEIEFVYPDDSPETMEKLEDFWYFVRKYQRKEE